MRLVPFEIAVDIALLVALVVLVVVGRVIADKPLLLQLLAAEAVAGPRLHLEPFGRNRALALRAQTELPGIETLEGRFDQRQLVLFQLGERQQEFPIVGADGVVDVVLGPVDFSAATVDLGADVRLNQL